MVQSVFVSAFVILLTTIIVVSGVTVVDYSPGAVWGGLCDSGSAQSPVNINTDFVCSLPSDTPRAMFVDFGVIEEYTVFSTGTSLEVEIDEFVVKPNISVPADGYIVLSENDGDDDDDDDEEGGLVRVEPRQLHFHTSSEHTIDGQYAPAELHFVTRVIDGQSAQCDESENGCFVVFGVMLQYFGRNGEVVTPAMTTIFSNMPTEIGRENGIRSDVSLDLNALFPEDKGYFTYLGGLTTPPCSEIVSWYVFHAPMPISVGQVDQHQEMAAFTPGADCVFTSGNPCISPREKTNHRQIQNLHNRNICST